MFLQLWWAALCGKTWEALNWIYLYNHSIYASFGVSKISPDKEAWKMTMRIFLVLVYIVLVECILHTRMGVLQRPQRVIHEHKTASHETHLAQTDSHTFADHCHIWDRWPFRINDAYLCNASKVSDSHRINHQSQYQLYCPESECHQQGITNGIHVDILGYCIDLHVTTTLEHVTDWIKSPIKQSWSAKQGALALQGSKNRQLSSMTHWRERTPSITLVMLFLWYFTL